MSHHILKIEYYQRIERDDVARFIFVSVERPLNKFTDDMASQARAQGYLMLVARYASKAFKMRQRAIDITDYGL